MRKSNSILFGAAIFLSYGCATVYPTVESIGHLSFNKDIENPKSIGPIEGSDCV